MVRRGLLAGLPVVTAVLVTLYYNAVRFGNPLDTGYLRDETLSVGSFWAGLAGLLFSPGRSVFVYSPILLAGLVALVALRHKDPRTMRLLAGEFVVLLCFYASLSNWDGERSYGPRYLLPVVPLLVLPLADWFARTSRPASASALLNAVVVLSVLVQIPGILVDFSKVGSAREIGPRTETERQWTWEASGLSLNTRASLVAIPENVRHLATGSVRRSSPVSATRATSRTSSPSASTSGGSISSTSAPCPPRSRWLWAPSALGAAAIFGRQLRLAYRHASH